MPAQPTTDGFLTGFFGDRRAAVEGGRRERIDRTDCDLRLSIEIGGEALLAADDRVVLAAERQFDRLGAVARIMPVAALPSALEGFVRDPLYRPSTADEARERLETCAALLRRLARDPALSGATRRLRRLDEVIRIELTALAPRRRRPGRRVRG